ncbi:hypothetical protein ACWD4J_11225 [Streptomyces sp. NPDC002577]
MTFLEHDRALDDRATAMGWTPGFGRLGSMLAPPLLGLIIGAGGATGFRYRPRCRLRGRFHRGRGHRFRCA